MTAEQLGPEASARAPRLPMWLDVTIAVVFGLFYAYDVWEVVESISVYAQAASFGIPVGAAEWVVLVIAAIAPLACFAAAFVLGRSRGLLARVALYFTGLCVSGALFLSLVVVLLRLGSVG